MSLIMLSFYACGNDSKEQALPELYFDVDETLLADTVVDDSLSVEFKVPKQLRALDAASRRRLGADLGVQEIPGTRLFVHPGHVFVSPNNSFFLMVNYIKSYGDSLNATEMESTYSAYLDEQLGERILRKGKFLKQGTPMTQYVLQDGTSTIMKVYLINNNTIVQFDYFVLADYDQRIKSIEASIGSIHILH